MYNVHFRQVQAFQSEMNNVTLSRSDLFPEINDRHDPHPSLFLFLWCYMQMQKHEVDNKIYV